MSDGARNTPPPVSAGTLRDIFGLPIYRATSDGATTRFDNAPAVVVTSALADALFQSAKEICLDTPHSLFGPKLRRINMC